MRPASTHRLCVNSTRARVDAFGARVVARCAHAGLALLPARGSDGDGDEADPSRGLGRRRQREQRLSKNRSYESGASGSCEERKRR